MLLLGHTGISLLAGWLADRQLRRSPVISPVAAGGGPQAIASAHPNPDLSIEAPRPRLAGAIDYRLVLLGALLPDIIDKPLALWILPDVFTSTRALAHTALFNTAFLLAGGALLARWGTSAVLVLALASTGHLVLDSMWSLTEVLWWPYHGWGFPEGMASGVGLWQRWLEALKEPGKFLSEAAGGVVLGVMSLVCWRRKGWARLLRSGKLG